MSTTIHLRRLSRFVHCCPSTPIMTMSPKNLICVLILFFINLINYMDRFTIAGVLDDVKKFYSLDDKWAGLLQTSFIVSYMITAPVFGYLGDRWTRKYIISGGVLFWSLTTYLGSVIPDTSPGWFFLMRALVGVGEASYSTIAPTIIADLFINEMRTRMLALFFFAIPVGSGLGYVVGSRVASAFGQWQWALRVTPGLGVASVLLCLFVLEEPERGQSEGAVDMHQHGIKDDLKYLTTNRSYIWSTAGFTCVSFATGALAWWAPIYMEYAYAVAGDTETKSETISLIFGLITSLAGIIGVLIGSGGAQWYRLRNPRADPLICAFGILISVPFAFFGIVIAHKSATLSWITIFIAITFLCVNWTLVADILLYVIPPNRRSFAQAIQILIAHLLGDAFSPYLVGSLSDGFRTRDSPASKYSSLQYALYSTSIVLVLGGVSFLYNAHYIVADKNRCKVEIQGHHLSSSESVRSSSAAEFNGNDEDVLQSFPPFSSVSRFESDLSDLIPRNDSNQN